MDGHDRTKLSAADISRQEWLDKYGSFLYCPERDTLCVYMDGKWPTGCELEVCIKDDPEHQQLEARIERNRARADEEARRRRQQEKNETKALIRNQSAQIKSYEQQRWDEIHRLEEQSAEAFRKNNPRRGETLFNRARIMRGDLRRYIQEKEEK